jgi:hypothetical protein
MVRIERNCFLKVAYREGQMKNRSHI